MILYRALEYRLGHAVSVSRLPARRPSSDLGEFGGSAMPSTRPAGRKKSPNSDTSRKAQGLDVHSVLASVGAGRSSLKCEAKQMIFRQGDPADAVFYVDGGAVQLMVVSEHGKER